MDELGRPVADLFGIDLIYGYLFVGVIIGFIVGRVTAPKPAVKHAAAAPVETAGGRLDIAPEVIEQVSALLARGEKIEAVRQLREATGFGLAEAKQVIDGLERRRGR